MRDGEEREIELKSDIYVFAGTLSESRAARTAEVGIFGFATREQLRAMDSIQATDKDGCACPHINVTPHFSELTPIRELSPEIAKAMDKVLLGLTHGMDNKVDDDDINIPRVPPELLEEVRRRIDEERRLEMQKEADRASRNRRLYNPDDEPPKSPSAAKAHSAPPLLTNAYSRPSLSLGRGRSR